MQRKPAILLCALLLLLSIGGAVFLQHLRQEKQASFTEIDSFLRNHAASGDWQFSRHLSKPPYNHPRAGWWDYLLIRRSDHFQTDQYFFGHDSKEHAAIASVLRKNGVVELLTVNIAYTTSGPVPYNALMEDIAANKQRADARLKELEKSIFGKFPQFAPEVVPEFP